jgi:hypothetical protein
MALDRSFGKVDALVQIETSVRKIDFRSAVRGMMLSAAGMGLTAFDWVAPDRRRTDAGN